MRSPGRQRVPSHSTATTITLPLCMCIAPGSRGSRPPVRPNSWPSLMPWCRLSIGCDGQRIMREGHGVQCRMSTAHRFVQRCESDINAEVTVKTHLAYSSPSSRLIFPAPITPFPFPCVQVSDRMCRHTGNAIGALALRQSGVPVSGQQDKATRPSGAANVRGASAGG